jgi:hypothetical protein
MYIYCIWPRTRNPAVLSFQSFPDKKFGTCIEYVSLHQSSVQKFYRVEISFWYIS